MRNNSFKLSLETLPLLKSFNTKKSTIKSFKSGGVLDVFIPSGKMHRSKHNLNKVIKSKYGTEVTDKGIPILDANFKQIAEMEVGELMINRDVTENLDSKSRNYIKSKDKKQLVKLGKDLYKVLNKAKDKSKEYK